MDQATLERFHPKTLADDVGECILWIGSRNAKGYGVFWEGQQRRGAHRVSYEHWVGPIPEGLQVDHLCRTPACVNPQHLEAVTPHENWRRGEQRSRRVQRSAQCIRGHDLTPENVTRGGFDKAGRQRWRCAECDRTNHRRAYRARTRNPG